MNIQNVTEGFALIEQGMGKLRSGPFEWYVKRLASCYEMLINRYAPHKVGDRVILTKTPQIDDINSPGWLGCRHFLVKGAVGTVREVSCDGDHFSFGVMFDVETYIDTYSGEAKPVDQKHTFFFREEYLVAARS